MPPEIRHAPRSCARLLAQRDTRPGYPCPSSFAYTPHGLHSVNRPRGPSRSDPLVDTRESRQLSRWGRSRSLRSLGGSDSHEESREEGRGNQSPSASTQQSRDRSASPSRALESVEAWQPGGPWSHSLHLRLRHAECASASGMRDVCGALQQLLWHREERLALPDRASGATDRVGPNQDARCVRAPNEAAPVRVQLTAVVVTALPRLKQETDESEETMNSATTNRSNRPRLTHAALLIALVLLGLAWGSNAKAIGAHTATGAGVYGESGLASVDDVTGAARYAVPFEVPEARGLPTVSLGLTYSFRMFETVSHQSTSTTIRQLSGEQSG